MEGLLQIETGPKRALFSLKSKKKYHVSVQGTSLHYQRDGEPTTIAFSTGTSQILQWPRNPNLEVL